MDDSALKQGELWGKSGTDWAELQEPMVRPAYERVFQRVDIQSGELLLDIGCGAGLASAMAQSHGAEVSGIDAAEPLLRIARRRVPEGDFRVGDIASLPWPDETFDVVLGFNSYQYADDPVGALRETSRVLRPGGRVGIIVWGPAEQCEAVAHFRALRALVPPPPDAPGPLAGEQAVAQWVEDGGLQLCSDELVDCPWRYPDVGTALRALMSAGPIARYIERAGRDAVERALTACVNGFRTDDGGVLFRNKFRALTATH